MGIGNKVSFNEILCVRYYEWIQKIINWLEIQITTWSKQ